MKIFGWPPAISALLFHASFLSREMMMATAQVLFGVDNPISDFTDPALVLVAPQSELVPFLDAPGVTFTVKTDDVIYAMGTPYNGFAIRFDLQCTNGTFKDVGGNDIGESVTLQVESFVPEGAMSNPEAMTFLSDSRTFTCNTNQDVLSGSLVEPNATVLASNGFVYRETLFVPLRYVAPFMGEVARVEFLDGETGEIKGSQLYNISNTDVSIVAEVACSDSTIAFFRGYSGGLIGEVDESWFSQPGGSMSVRFRVVNIQDENIRAESDDVSVFKCSDTVLPDVSIEIPSIYAMNNGLPVAATLDFTDIVQGTCDPHSFFFEVRWFDEIDEAVYFDVFQLSASEPKATFNASCVDRIFQLPSGVVAAGDFISFRGQLNCGDSTHVSRERIFLHCLDELPPEVEDTPERIVFNFTHSKETQYSPDYFIPTSVISDLRATLPDGLYFAFIEFSSPLTSGTYNITQDAFASLGLIQDFRCIPGNVFVDRYRVYGDQLVTKYSFGITTDDIIFRSPEFVYNCLPPETMGEGDADNSTMVDDEPDEMDGSGSGDENAVDGNQNKTDSGSDENDGSGMTCHKMSIKMFGLLACMMLMHFL